MGSDRHIQTIEQAYHDICASEPPWVALGNFLNEWHDYSRDRRDLLVAELIRLPQTLSDEQWRWAVFCVSAVECLCEQYDIPCPAWASDPAYSLEQPWYGFDSSGAADPQVRAYLQRTTPPPFRRRNIYCGNRVLATKYDFAARHGRSGSRLGTD
jgi:hypothetical protein